MEDIHQELKYEVLQGHLVDKCLTANQAFHLGGIIKVWPPGCAIFAEYRHHAGKIVHRKRRRRLYYSLLEVQ